MPDFGRWTSNGGDPSLNEINRTDRFLDALAAQQPVYSTDPGEAELAYLMARWCDEVRTPPVTTVITRHDASVALHRSLASRHRTRMSMAVAGSVAAAMLCLGGFGAAINGAAPGDALYGLRTAVFGEPQTNRDDRVVLAAQTQLAEVQQLIEQGNWAAAQDKLEAVSTTVQTVDDTEQKRQLQEQMNRLTVKVEARDPNAEPPPAPVVPPPVNVPLPAIVDSSTTTGSTTTTSETSPPSEPSTASSEPSSPPAEPPPVSKPPTVPTPTKTTTTTTISPPVKPPPVEEPPTQEPVEEPPVELPAEEPPEEPAEQPALGGEDPSDQRGGRGDSGGHGGSDGEKEITIPVTTTPVIQLPKLGGEETKRQR